MGIYFQGYWPLQEVRGNHGSTRFGQALCLGFSIVRANSEKSSFIRYPTPTVARFRIGWLGVSSMKYDFQGYLRLNEVSSNHGVTRFGQELYISLSIARWHWAIEHIAGTRKDKRDRNQSSWWVGLYEVASHARYLSSYPGELLAGLENFFRRLRRRKIFGISYNTMSSMLANISKA